MRAAKFTMGLALTGAMLLAGCGGPLAQFNAPTSDGIASAMAIPQIQMEPDDDVPGLLSQIISAPGFNVGAQGVSDEQADAEGTDAGNDGDGDGDDNPAWQRAHFHLTPPLQQDANGDPVDPYPGDPLNGVYHPYRLIVQNPWTTMSGTVSVVRKEADGDWHIDVMPDAPYQGMVNDKNDSAQGGALVVEVIPNDQGNVQRPSAGDHIQVWGPFVNDKVHGWNEVHPVRDLTEL